jgi:peptidyl-prolyl cis-trans isomerase D
MIKFLQTPGKLKKYVLGGLLLVICVSMVTYLIPGGGIMGELFGLGLTQAGVVAKVGNEEVTAAAVDAAVKQMGRQQFPQGFPPQFRPFLAQRAAQELITEKALVTEAGRLGFRVTNEEVSDFLRHSQFAEQLFPGGTPVTQEQYENFVRQFFDMTTPQFEDMLKTSLLIAKLRALVEGSVTVSNAELQEAYKQQHTKVKFEYAVISSDQILKEIKPTEAELKAYYDSHKQQYVNSIPEKRQVKFVLIENAELAKQIPVTPDEVLRYYNSHQENYRVPDRVNVGIIEIKTPLPGPDGKVDQKALDAARAKAEDVLKKLKAGGNFAQLAKEYSQDEASKDKGGSIGWIGHGQTDPEFEKAAFSLPKGGTSNVVQTSLGFEIIHVDDKETAHVKPLDEVQPQIEAALRQDKLATRSADLATKIENQARTLGLDKAAAQHGLQAATTGLFGRGETVTAIGSSPEFMDAVFSAPAGAPADSVQTQKGWVVYQVTQIKPPATPTFEEAKSQVESQFKNDRAAQLLRQKTQELADRAKAEHNLKKAAAALGATMKTSELVAPVDQVPDVGAMSGAASEVFNLKPGEISGPMDTGRNGVVAQLLERQEPNPADFEKEKDQLRENLLQQKRNDAMELFAANLRQRLEKEKKIRINEQEWNKITGKEAGS